jgi:hypothetical protein
MPENEQLNSVILNKLNSSALVSRAGKVNESPDNKRQKSEQSRKAKRDFESGLTNNEYDHNPNLEANKRRNKLPIKNLTAM